MFQITQTFKAKYYTYQPSEFLPVYLDGKLTNKREFHKYRIGWIIKHRQAFAYQLTHQSGC